MRNGRRLTIGLAVLVATIGLPVLYVLSIGPALQIAVRCAARPGPDDERPMQIFHNIYGPLFSAAKATGTERVLRDYVSLWD